MFTLSASSYLNDYLDINKPLCGLVPRRELRPVEQVLRNDHGGRDERTNGIALPELFPALLGRN